MPGATLTPGDTVNFRVGLPRVWNPKFYFQGTGGFAVLSFGASTRHRATATNKETAMRLLAALGPTLGPDGPAAIAALVGAPPRFGPSS
jgi:hypothetical protein